LNLETLDGYLTRTGPMLGSWDGEEAARHALAAEGPSIVIPTLRRSRDKLKSFGRSLNHFLAVTPAEIGINLTFQRAADLLAEVLEASRESRKTVSGLLVKALQSEEDADVRALAALFCGLNGVVKEAVASEVARVFVQDEDLLVRTAAAAVLPYMNKVPNKVKADARQVVSVLVKHMRPGLFEQHSKGGKPRGEGAYFAFAGTVMALVPKLIAERDSPSPMAAMPSPSGPPAPGPSATSGSVASDLPASGTSDMAERLRQLDDLRAKNLITDDEYQAKRKALLDRL
jgi:hypothetical protein